MIEADSNTIWSLPFFVSILHEFFPKARILGIGAGIRGMGINTRLSPHSFLSFFLKEMLLKLHGDAGISVS